MQSAKYQERRDDCFSNQLKMEPEIELREGKISTEELANWFGVKKKTFQNSKVKKLEELKIFADFKEVEKGYYYISKVKIPIYCKKGSRAYNIVKRNFFNAWHKSGYDTASRVGSQIYSGNTELKKTIQESTAKAYTARVRSEFYGKVWDQNDRGSKGTCKFAYVKENNWNEAILLTEEQNKKINEIRKTIYTNEQESFLYDALLHHEITQEEYDEGLQSWNTKEARAERYFTFLDQVSEMLGFPPDKVTLLINDSLQ